MRISLLVSILLFSQLVLSAASATVIVSIDRAGPVSTILVGEEIRLDVRASADQPILGWGLDVLFDPEVFEVVAAPEVSSIWTGLPASDGDGLAGAAFPIGLTGSDLLLASVVLRAVAIGEARVETGFTPGDLAEGFPLDPTGFETDVRFEGVDLTVIPEPGTGVLLLLGLAGLGVRNDRRRAEWRLLRVPSALRGVVRIFSRSTRPVRSISARVATLALTAAVIGISIAPSSFAQTQDDFDARFPPDLWNQALISTSLVITPFTVVSENVCLIRDTGAICSMDSWRFEMVSPTMTWDGGPKACNFWRWHQGSSNPGVRSSQMPIFTPEEIAAYQADPFGKPPISLRLSVSGMNFRRVDPTDPITAAELNQIEEDRLAAVIMSQQASRIWIFWPKHNSGCTDSEPVIAPTSVFTWRSVGETTIRFDGSPTIPGSSNISNYLWNFGDGSPIAQGPDAVIEHKYANPGPYRVLLRTTNRNGESNDFQMNIKADEGIVFEIDTPTPEYKVGTDSTAKITVTSFLENENVLTFTDPLLDSDDDAIVNVPGVSPPEGIVVSSSLPPYVVSVPIQALKGGVAQLTSSVVARDPGTGKEISVQGAKQVVVDPFEVTVEASPEQFLVNETLPTDLDEECRKYNQGRGGPDSPNPAVANCMAVRVIVKNVGTTPVTNVEMRDATNLSGPAIKSLDPEILDVPLVDLAFIPDPANPPGVDLQPDKTAKFTWLLRADGGSPNLEITALVNGTVSGVAVQGSGKGKLKLVENRILRFGVKELNPGRPFISGSPIRIEGFLENLSTSTHIGVSVFPIVEGNAGRGNLWDVNEGIPPVTERVANDNVNSACRRFAEVEAAKLMQFPTGFVLPPKDPEATEGSKVDLEGVLATLCWDDLSIAKVRYVAVAYTLDTDEDGNLLNEAGAPMALDELGLPRPGQGAPRRLDRLVSQIEYVEEGDFERQITVLLRENPDLAQDVLSECAYQEYGFSIACEGARGVYSLGYGLVQMPPMLWEATKSVVTADVDYGIRLGHWTAEQWSNMYKAWIENDPDAYRKLIDEAKLLTDSLVLASVITANQQEKLVVKAAEEIGKIATDYEKGNYEKLAGRIAFAAGENADALISGPIARALVAKIHRARGLSRADEIEEVTNAVQDAVEKISDEVDEIKTSDKFRAAEAADPDVNITTAGVAKANDPLSYHAIETWVGVARDTVVQIEKICDRFGITVAFRSRGVGAIAKLKKGLAYLKPQAMKIKNTNDLDIKYLGYPPEARDVVVFIEPPISPPPGVNLSRKEWANDLEMTAALDDYMTNTLGKSKPAGLDRVDSRIAEATFDQRIDLKIEDFEVTGVDADEYFQIRERLRLRMQEWQEFSKADKLGTPTEPGDWAVNGIPLAFGYEANGLGSILDKMPKMKGSRQTLVVEEGFRVLDDNGNVASIVREIGTNAQGAQRKILHVAMDGPNSLRPFTGDIDFLHILDSTGALIRNPVRRFFIYMALASEIGMQHGESFTFALGKLTTRSRYLNPHLLGKKGAEFLTTISPGNVKRVGFYAGARAVLSDLGNGVRQFDPGHHFIPVTSLSQTLRSEADILKRIYRPRTRTEFIEDFFAKAAFWLAPLKKISEHTKRVDQAIVAQSFSNDPSDSKAQVPQPMPNGDLGVLQPSTTPPIAEPAHAVGHGDGPPIPQVRLEWRAIAVEDAIGSNGLINSLPISALSSFPEPGSDQLEVVSLEDLEMPASSPFFEIGQYVALNPTQPTQEINRIYSVDPLILERPLAFAHEAGEIVSVLPTRFLETACTDCGTPAGDLDLDGDVDDDDRAIFFASFGSSEGWVEYNDRSDLDGDGSITFVDYQLWLESFREEQLADPAPEPARVLMLLVGVAALAAAASASARRRKFRSAVGSRAGTVV